MAEVKSSYELSENAISHIDHWLTKFPEDQKQSGVLAALHIVQQEDGFVSKPAMKAVANYLGMPEIAVYEVATFYTMYKLQPKGKHTVSVCTNISCQLCGSEDIVKHLQKRLGVGFGQNTKDGKFHLEEVECLAACCGAPAMQIDNRYYEHLTPEKIDKILESME